MKSTTQRRVEIRPALRNCIGEVQDGEADLEQSLEELVSEVDKTDDGETEPHTKNPI